MRTAERYHYKRIGHIQYPRLADAILHVAKRVGRDCKTVIDIGASVGELLKGLSRLQHWDVMLGIDHGEYASKYFWGGADYIDFNIDNGELKRDFGTFDLIISMEVAEHLKNPQKLLQIIYNCSHIGSLIVFSGARCGQRGRGHVSCKNGWEWILLLMNFGFVYEHYLTAKFHQEVGAINSGGGRIISDCYSNTMFFSRRPQK